MPYVQRNASGAVIGTFNLLQLGYAEERLPDANPEVIAFLNPPVGETRIDAEDLFEMLRKRTPPGISASDVPADRRRPPRRP